MDALNYLYQALEEKISNQLFYNECMVKAINPVARELFARLRDEETSDIEMLQKEILFIESRPSAVRKIFFSDKKV